MLIKKNVIVFKYLIYNFAGQEELMKGVGKDATKIFDEVHAWVNYEQLLAKCYVGPLLNATTITITSSGTTNSKPSTSNSLNALKEQPGKSGFKMPKLTSLQNLTQVKKTTDSETLKLPEIIPRFDWIQKSAELIIIFYTQAMCNPGFSIELISDIEIVIRIFIERVMHICTFKLAYPVEWPFSSKISNETGKPYLLYIIQ